MCSGIPDSEYNVIQTGALKHWTVLTLEFWYISDMFITILINIYLYQVYLYGVLHIQYNTVDKFMSILLCLFKHIKRLIKRRTYMVHVSFKHKVPKKLFNNNNCSPTMSFNSRIPHSYGNRDIFIPIVSMAN